jgi:hypothetical protein
MTDNDRTGSKQFNMDNTGKENKNHWLHTMIGTLFLRWGLARELVIIGYNVVGHTHGPCDRLFSLVSSIIDGAFVNGGESAMWVLEDLKRMFEANVNNGNAEVVEDLPAFTAWLDWVCILV